MVAVAPVLLSVATALISHTVCEHGESPVTAPATPNCCCWPVEHATSSALLGSRVTFLIGATVTQAGCGVSVIVNSGVPSELMSTQRVLAVPHGSGTALAGLTMNCGVLMVFSIVSCATLIASAFACMLPTTRTFVFAVLSELTAKSVSSTSMMSATMSVVPRCLRMGVMACLSFRRDSEYARAPYRCGGGKGHP